jgi:hypothetical protein
MKHIHWIILTQQEIQLLECSLLSRENDRFEEVWDSVRERRERTLGGLIQIAEEEILVWVTDGEAIKIKNALQESVSDLSLASTNASHPKFEHSRKDLPLVKSMFEQFMILLRYEKVGSST